MKKLSVLMAGALFACSAVAQDRVTHLGDGVVSAKTLIDALTPKPKYKVRGIRFNAQDQGPPSVALSVHFAHDSAELSEQALAQLNPLGEALKSEQLAAFSFAIDGHTDASGSEQYNMTLSQRRALAVGNYLYANYGVDATRLNLTGKGESELYDAAQPRSGLNRRVQITTLEAPQPTDAQEG